MEPGSSFHLKIRETASSQSGTDFSFEWSCGVAEIDNHVNKKIHRHMSICIHKYICIYMVIYIHIYTYIYVCIYVEAVLSYFPFAFSFVYSFIVSISLYK